MSKVTNPLGQKNVDKNYKPDSSPVGISWTPGVYLGIVKRNADPQKMGRLWVYIKDFGGDPTTESSWIPCVYASPFGGNTSIYKQGTNVESYDDTIKSYGFWAVPPDLETLVLVTIPGGKSAIGYWFACVYQRGVNVSVPGIPALNTYGGENKPAAPKNRRDVDPDLEKYVEHRPMSDALKKQGLDKDPVRGTSSSGATRESPSKVIGLLTPGQHQFVMDDGDAKGNNRLIRLRTANGTQILLDDVAGHIYMITKDGENWIEMSGSGSIHMYSATDINIRSGNNINLRADNDVNIEAGSTVNIKAADGSLKMESSNEVAILAGTNTKITSTQTSNINSGTGHYETAGVIHMNGPIALAANPISTYTLAANNKTTQSICSNLPEREPWQGHSGLSNPVGHGNQQMKKDPAPDKIPRKPLDGEMGAKLKSNTNVKMTDVSLEDVRTSTSAQNLIKKLNGYSPVNVADGNGQSGGFGSAIIPATPPGS